MPAVPTVRRKPSWLVPAIVLVLAAVLIAVAVTIGGGNDAVTDRASALPPDGAPSQGPDLRDFERRDPNDLLTAGPVDAPVALVVFSDYQCPFCARWSAETLPLMMAQAEAGKLRIEWRDVNVFGPESERAARASYAAAQQGAFWEYHDALFAGGRPQPKNKLSDEALTSLAGALGLDAARFATDLVSAQTADQIATNAALGLDLGAFSTPVFILGGEPIVGAQPSEVFVETFDNALAAAG